MNITNGSVSRMYRPADFENRTVTLNFNIEPGDDYDAAIKTVSQLAERHACRLPADAPRGLGVSNVGDKTPEPEAQPAKTVKKPPVQVEDPAATPAEPATPDLTDADMNAVVHAARERGVLPEQIKACINKYVDKPGMSMKSLGPQKRALLRVDLEAVKAA
jgi:hypothetical protein